MVPRKLHVPAFRDESSVGLSAAGIEGSTGNQYSPVVVVRWGRIGGFTFRAGDRLVLEEDAGSGLLLLRPRGYGWPMLGRRAGGALLAEPGGVPAGLRRWQVAASVVGVERALDRAVVDSGDWYVVVRTVSAQGLPTFVMRGWCTARELDEQCHVAHRAHNEAGEQVAIGAALAPERAVALAKRCADGCVLMDVARPEACDTPSADIIVGPWNAPPPVAPSSPPAYEAPVFSPPAAEVAGPAQLSLFGRIRSNRAS